MSIDKFTIELKKDLVDTDEKIERAIQRIAMECLIGVVRKTPVATGRLRNNWITSVDRMNSTTIQSADGAGQSISRGTPVVEGFEYKKNKMIIIQNNLPYANRIENGHSKKAPQGMVAPTINDVRIKNRNVLV
tara:strand:- start:51 stop:449 length:399 start_codon:yes stop_codon:yes gene_type:complete